MSLCRNRNCRGAAQRTMGRWKHSAARRLGLQACERCWLRLTHLTVQIRDVNGIHVDDVDVHESRQRQVLEKLHGDEREASDGRSRESRGRHVPAKPCGKPAGQRTSQPKPPAPMTSTRVSDSSFAFVCRAARQNATGNWACCAPAFSSPPLANEPLRLAQIRRWEARPSHLRRRWAATAACPGRCPVWSQPLPLPKTKPRPPVLGPSLRVPPSAPAWQGVQTSCSARRSEDGGAASSVVVTFVAATTESGGHFFGQVLHAIWCLWRCMHQSSIAKWKINCCSLRL